MGTVQLCCPSGLLGGNLGLRDKTATALAYELLAVLTLPSRQFPQALPDNCCRLPQNS